MTPTKASNVIKKAWESYCKGVISYTQFCKIRHYAITQIMEK